MKKNLFFAAIALVALAGCTSDDFVGDQNLQKANENGAISFGSKSQALTRATSNTGSVAEMLDGQMIIYGVKKINSGSTHVTPTPASDSYSTVFNNYQLWSSATATTSNYDSDWEYVGAAGTHGSYVNSSSVTVSPTVTIASGKDQYIKYWDWSTDEYHFVAGSPVSSFTYNLVGSAEADAEIESATVTGINGHINVNTTGTPLGKDPVYIAAPVKKVNGTDYNTDVEFRFSRQQSFVRVGVYEDIPGYMITSIDFYEWDYTNTAWKASPQSAHNIVLNSKTDNYFKGGAASATVTYDWTTLASSFVFASAGVEQESWYGGKLDLSDTNPLATSSTDTRKDYFYGTDDDIDATTKYFTVLPTPSATTAQPIIIKCDYTLKALDTNETIKVSGATAAIPAAFCKWNPNTSYTYLFKISDNTNGKTGSSQPNEGLYPITFDAVVTSVSDGAQGYTTTVSTPSITTYQDGSVTDAGIEYKYNSTDPKPIYFTVQDNTTGDLNTLSTLNNGLPALGMVQVYTVAAGTTEADLILTRPTTTVTTSVGSAAWTINDQSVASGKWGSFTPTAAGTYAIEYITQASPVAYSYKVIVVE